MASCEKCGKELPEDAASCSACEASDNSGQSQANQGADDNKLMAMLDYILFFIPILGWLLLKSSALQGFSFWFLL